MQQEDTHTHTLSSVLSSATNLILENTNFIPQSMQLFSRRRRMLVHICSIATNRLCPMICLYCFCKHYSLLTYWADRYEPSPPSA